MHEVFKKYIREEKQRRKVEMERRESALLTLKNLRYKKHLLAPKAAKYLEDLEKEFKDEIGEWRIT